MLGLGMVSNVLGQKATRGLFPLRHENANSWARSGAKAASFHRNVHSNFHECLSSRKLQFSRRCRLTLMKIRFRGGYLQHSHENFIFMRVYFPLSRKSAPLMKYPFSGSGDSSKMCAPSNPEHSHRSRCLQIPHG